MNTRKYEGILRLEPQQKLLLRASLLKGEVALEAWRQWKSSVDVEKIDLDSYRILALLYSNLSTHGVRDLSMGKYGGVYRQTCYRNRLLFHALVSVLRSFGDAGVETVVLRGAALSVLYYKNYGLRPMNNVDILIHTNQASAAINLLRVLGWTPVNFDPTEKHISVSHSHGFRNEKGQEINLHWHLLSQSRETDDESDFWNGAITFNISGVVSRTLNPTDQLLHICIHGARWNYIPGFQWIADAVTILRTSQSEIDWARMISQIRKRRLVLPLKDSLDYLLYVVDAPVSLEALRNIHEISVARIERIEHMIKLNRPTLWTATLDLWCQHSRLMKNRNLLYRLLSFPMTSRLWPHLRASTKNLR